MGDGSESADLLASCDRFCVLHVILHSVSKHLRTLLRRAQIILESLGISRLWRDNCETGRNGNEKFMKDLLVFCPPQREMSGVWVWKAQHEGLAQAWKVWLLSLDVHPLENW